MSVNRFERTTLMPCAPPDALMAENTAMDGAMTVIVDIREDWATERTADEVRSALARRQTTAGYTLLRVGWPDGETGQHALERLAALRPDGFVLSSCGGVADIQKFDVMLRVAEAEHGIAAGSIALVAEVGENTAFALSASSLKDVSRRLAAIVFDGAGLTQATASQPYNAAASRAGAPLLLARAAAVITARQAGLPCYELLQENTRDDPRTARDIALADGFSGVIARNAAQLAALRV